MDTAPPAIPSGNIVGRSLIDEVPADVVIVDDDGDVIFDIRATLQIMGDELDIIPDEAKMTFSPKDVADVVKAVVIVVAVSCAEIPEFAGDEK